MDNSFWTDLKYSWRLLGNSSGFSALCVLVVALSVGLAMWSNEIVYSVALKPLPFSGSDRWLSLQLAPDATHESLPEVDAYTYQEILKRNRSVDHLGAFSEGKGTLSQGQASTILRTAAVSPSLFAAMGVAPIMGRLFTKGDGENGAVPTGVLSYDTWTNYFAADPAVIGKEVRLDGRPLQIIGVMPRTFFAFRDFELFLPLHLSPLARPGDSHLVLTPIIRLHDGDRAGAILGQIQPAVDEVNKEYPQLFNAARYAALFPAKRIFTHAMVPFVTLVAAVSIGVMLLGAVNISMVFFARLLERRRELALRAALGSSRWRLIRQCLLETMFVFLLGLLLAMGLAWLGIRWGQNIGEYPARILDTGRPGDLLALRWGDVLTATAAAIALWLLSTLVPAWRISNQDAAEVLGGSGKGVANVGSARSAGVLVGLQVIVSSLVLVICANMVVAVKVETNRPSGLSQGVLSSVMLSTYPTPFTSHYADAASRLHYWDELRANILDRLPGAQVAYATAVPTRPTTVPAGIEGLTGAAGSGTLELPVATVSENYFSLLGIQLRAGRLFEATDDAHSQPVAVIDEQLAHQYWPDRNPVGRRMQLNPKQNGPWLTIVGVTSHVGAKPYSQQIGTLYRPLRQVVPDSFQLLVRLPNGAANGRETLREVAYGVDPNMPLLNPQMLDEFLAALDINYGALTTAFTAIAVITLMLAASGLFGIIMRSVARRTQEIGIRRALGGTRWRVTLVFLKQGAVYLAVGLVGLTAGILMTNALSGSITNILEWALPVTSGVLAVMAVVVVSASYLPTLRAMALEPGDALRYE